MNICRKNQFLSILVTGAILVNFSIAGNEKPGWVENRPVHPAYFIGIGVAQKNTNSSEYRKIAKDDALKDLSSEIMVNISSEFVHTIVEQSGMLEDEVRSQVNSSTRAKLEGYELVDTWEDENEYWLYYRLPKELYQKQRKIKINKAMNLSLDMFSNAKKSENQNNITSALMFYLQSLNSIQDYISEPLQTNYKGSDIFLQNEIYSSLQSLLNQIELKVAEEKISAKVGQPLKTPLTVSAFYTNKDGNKITVSNLPLRFSFIKGSGELVEKAQTDQSGIAKCQIVKVRSMNKIQIVKVELDIIIYKQNDLSVILENIIKNLAMPGNKYILYVSGPAVFIDASEIYLGKELDILYIEPRIKNALSECGFSFSNNISDADILIELKAVARKGVEVYNLYTAFVDLTISATDMSSGKEVYKNSINRISGTQLDFEKAAIAALEEAGEKIEEIIPDLINKIR